MSSRSDFLSKRRRRAIYVRDNFSCRWCRREPIPAPFLTLDHLVPRAHGGTHATRNLVTACYQCNSQRGSRSLLQFARIIARHTGESTGQVLLRVLGAAETPILHRPTVRDARRQSGQLSMVLQEGTLR